MKGADAVDPRRGCTIIPDWLMLRKDFTLIEKACYARMSRYCLKHGYGWASQETIAAELDTTARQVRRCLRRFLDEGMVKISKPRPGSRDTNIFRTFVPPRFIKEFEEMLARSEGLSEERQQRAAEIEAPPSWEDLQSSDGGPTVLLDRTCNPLWEDGVSRKETREETKEETEKRNKPLAGSLRSPFDASLRSPSFRTSVSLTEEQISPFEITSPKWTDAAEPAVLPQPPAPGVALASEWNMAVDLKHLNDVVTRAAEKNKAAVELRVKRRDAKEQKLKNLKGAIVTTGAGAALRRMESLWLEEFTKKFPTSLIAKWEGKERGQMKALIGLYSEEDVARAVRYYIRYWDNHRPRFFKGTAALPNLGQLRAAHAQIIPEAKQMFQALQVQSEYKKWSTDNRMTALPPPKALQEAYDRVKSDLKSLGF